MELTPPMALALFRAGQDTFDISKTFGVAENCVLEMVTRQREADLRLPGSYRGVMPLWLVPYSDRTGKLQASGS